MGITAAQLVAEVAINGSEAGRRELLEIAHNADQTQSSLDKIGPATSRASSGFMSGFLGMRMSLLDFGAKLGQTIFGLQNLWQGFTGLVSGMFDADASMEQTTTAFTQLLGSSQKANAELKDLANFAAATPFEFPELADATQKLIAFQFPLQQTKPLLTAIGDALSGLGQNTPEKLNQIVQVFGQMNSAGKMTTGDLQQLSQVGINGFQILADTMGKPVSVIRDMVSHGLIPAGQGIEALRRGMEKTFGGGMLAQSQTFNGLISTLQDNIGAAWRSFSGPLFAQAKEALISIGNLVSSPAFQQFATTLGTVVGGAIKTFLSNSQILIPVLAGLATIIGIVLVGAAIAFVTSLSPLILIVLGVGAAVAGLTAGFMALYNNNAGFRAFIEGTKLAFQQLWTVIQTNVIPAFQNAAAYVQANFLPTMNRIGTFIQTVVWPALQQVGAFLVSTFTPVWQQLASVWQGQILPALQQLWGALQPALPALKAIGAVVLGVLVLGFIAFIGVLKGVISAIAVVISDVASAIAGVIQVITGIVQVVAGILRVIYDLFTGNFSDLGSALGSIWQGIINILGGGFQVLGSIVHAVFGGILAFLGGFFSMFAGAIGAAFSAIGAKIGSIFSAIGTTIHNILSAIGTGIGNFFSWLGGFVQAAMAFLLNAFTLPFRAIGALFVWLYQHNRYFQALIDGIRSIVGAGLAWLQQAWSTVISWLASVWNTLSGLARNAWNAVSGAVSGVVNSIVGTLRNVWQAAINDLSAKWNTLRNFAQTAWNNVAGVFSGAWGRISGILSGLWSNIAKSFSDVAGRAIAWGKNIIQGIIDGINAMIGSLKNAAANAASAVAGFLGFHSPAKEGPGRDLDKWPRNMIRAYAEGIEASIPTLQHSLNLAVQPIASSLGGFSSSPVSPGVAAIPASLANTIQPTITVQPAPVMLDGRSLAQGILPYIVDAIRVYTGTRM